MNELLKYWYREIGIPFRIKVKNKEEFFRIINENNGIKTIYYSRFLYPDVFKDKEISPKIVREKVDNIAKILGIIINYNIRIPRAFVIHKNAIVVFNDDKLLAAVYIHSDIFFIPSMLYLREELDKKTREKAFTHEIIHYLLQNYHTPKSIEENFTLMLEEKIYKKQPIKKLR